jgi:transposase
MDREKLAAMLAEGRSIESIARETGRAPSTVAYWVKKFGLSSQHAPRHAAQGGLGREELEALVAEGVSIRGMAERLGVSYTTVRHWLRRY